MIKKSPLKAKRGATIEVALIRDNQEQKMTKAEIQAADYVWEANISVKDGEPTLHVGARIKGSLKRKDLTLADVILHFAHDHRSSYELSEGTLVLEKNDYLSKRDMPVQMAVKGGGKVESTPISVLNEW